MQAREFPLTEVMMHIATHPSDNWLQEYCAKHNPKPKSPPGKKLVPEIVLDPKGGFIKHLASKGKSLIQ